MLAAESRPALITHHPKPGFRRPLQPKNVIFPSTNPITKDPKNSQNVISSAGYNAGSNKENYCRVLPGAIELPLDASLAEELSAVREKMERLRLDREKTDKLLQERVKLLDFQMYELEERGEFQRELEIEVDRLFRLKQLKLACMRMSPIRSLRDKEIEKKSQEVQFESTKTEESKEEIVDRSSTESSSLSLGSTSASTTLSTASTSNSTATSKMSITLPRLSLEIASNK